MRYTRATMPDRPNLAISPERRAMLEVYVDRITSAANAEGEYRRRWHEQHPGAASRVYFGEES